MNFTYLNYTANLSDISAVSSLLANKWAILLDSGNYNKASENGRYDIFSALPCISIESKQINKEQEYKLDIVTHSPSLTNLTINSLDHDPLTQMRSLLSHVKDLSDQKALEQTKANSRENKIPFKGGWLGYFSYDFGKTLELTDTKPEDEFDIPHCIFGLYRWALISDHKNKTTKLFNFGLCEDEWKNILTLFQNELTHNSKHCDSKSPKQETHDLDLSFTLNEKFRSNLNFESYRNNFKVIQENILAGNCYQINYAHRFEARFEGNSFTAYRYLSQVNKSPFSAYLNFGKFQILSLSPERFIKVKNKSVITQPIKGTAPRNKDKAIDQQLALALTQSEKDRAENLMIVDLLRNDLSKTASQASVDVPELFGLYSFESVHHLISTVTSQLAPQFDSYDVMQTCLPGGSITGAPKIAAMKIIDQLEDFKRGIYCGVIGYIDFEGNMDTNICIRTLLAKNGSLFCWAGGGIVFDSNVESEYKETFHKISKIIPILEQEFLEGE
ncbi:MAG: aminodeoxychorismate synthase component I [Kangiellaceae bacterium]